MGYFGSLYLATPETEVAVATESEHKKENNYFVTSFHILCD